MDEENFPGPDEDDRQPKRPQDQHGPMLWVAIAMLAFLVFLVIFANIPDIRASAGTAMTKYEWQLHSYTDATGAMEPVLSGASVTLMFPEDGIAAGRSGCGYYSVNYMTKDYSIAISDLVLADLLCQDAGVMDLEAAYLGDLTNSTEFRVSETTLTMYGKDGKALLVFIRQD